MGWDKGTDDAYGFLKPGESLTLVEFRASWCVVCKEQSLVLEQIARECPLGIEIQRIDIEDDPERAIAMGIQSVPTLILYKQGEEVLRLIGMQDADTMWCVLRDYLDGVKR